MSRLSADLVRKYAWAEPLALELVWAVTVVEGSSLPTVVRAFGGDPSTPEGMLTFREAEREVRRSAKEFGEFFFFQVFTHGRYVVALENNGYSGVIPELGRRVTAAGGRYFSYFRNDNGASKLVQAIDGRITAYLEPLFADEPQQIGEIRPAWIGGVGIDTETLWATCFALLEEQTGLAFDPDWFNTKLPTYRIPDPYNLFKDVEGADVP
ncbi:DUF6461 domain-containing protein [Actinokineospora iranica]|uniref:Uncharacterized protein n=1 Tax=Actinokineospora iranica TaxID=1271860 RepID=A0A1G6Z969_9PSEU|nr:DUF6461 domain-containing protein [Actinokineospora iranica]SDD98537.1 hypothetical protein SAMN05216174_12638 [Actinokineospora iranica]